MRTISDECSAPMMPTVPLGDLLLAVRSHHGSTLADIGRRAGLAPDRVAAVESGRHDLSDDELASVLDAYPQAGPRRRPPRLTVEIDLDAGVLSLRPAGARPTRRGGVRRGRRQSVPAADRNLVRYLILVHEHFDLDLGRDIPLKAADLGLLRASLALRRDEVTNRLDRMTGAAGGETTRGRSLLAVAVATGLVVAAGAVVLIPARSGPIEPADRGFHDEVVPTPTPRLDIGTPMVVERTSTDATGDRSGDGSGDSSVDSSAAISADPVPVETRIGMPLVVERPVSVAPATTPNPGDPEPRGPPRD